MQFKDFKGRRVGIKLSNKKEIAEYIRQRDGYHHVRDFIRIKDDPNYTYLTIQSEAGRQIGIIEVYSDGSYKNAIASLTDISIPNNAWRARYGTEALHQFIKCCRNQKLYKKMYLVENNSITQAYKRERPEAFENDSIELV